MIKAKELRLGNNFKDDEGNILTCFGVAPVDDSDQFNIWYGNELGFILLEEEADPIPLTEEWLIKFGFEKTSDNMYWVQPDNFMYFELNNFGIIATFPDSVADFGKRVNNVHSLQNLYFALTGEELTIRD